MKRSRLVRAAVGVAALLAWPLPLVVHAAVVPTALLVDPCRSHADSEEPQNDQASEVTLIDFLAQPPAPPAREVAWVTSRPDPHGGAAFATLRGYQQTHVFVTHGGTLDVYDVSATFLGTPAPSLVRSVDVASLVGVPGLRLGRIAAGKYAYATAEPDALFPQASLYLVGTRPDLQAAWSIVLDQQFLIEGVAPTPTVVYDFEPICASPGECTVPAVLDIRVGDLTGHEVVEEAYIGTVTRFGSTDAHVVYRLERELDVTAFTLYPAFGSYWQSADDPLAPPLVPSASGLRFAPRSHDVYVLHKYERQVRNLTDSSVSCVLAGEPTDVAVWKPGLAGVDRRYLLATSWDGASGRLDVFRAGPCIAGQAAPTLSIPTGEVPASLDLYPVDADEVWALVASSTLFEAFHLRFQSVGGVDSFTVLEARTLPTYVEVLDGTCPSFVAFGKRQEVPSECVPPPDCTGIDRKCLKNDPRCPP